MTSKGTRLHKKGGSDVVADKANPVPKAALRESRAPMLDVPETHCVGCGGSDFSPRGFYREAGWTEVSREGNHLTKPLVRMCFGCYDSWRGIMPMEAIA